MAVVDCLDCRVHRARLYFEASTRVCKAPEEEALPKQNKPVVRDGRLQAPKKRTDRSYLGTTAAPEIAPSEVPSPEQATDPVAAFEAPAAVVTPPTPQVAAAPVTAPAAQVASAPAARRRREVDPDELLAQDSSYAIHELRRIGIIAAIILGTLIGLGVFMR
jgi:hypothetical protein